MESETPSPPSPEERFQTNVVGLGELLCDIVAEVNKKGYDIINPKIIELAVRILQNLDHTSVIDTFIIKSNERKGMDEEEFLQSHCWEKIRARDRSFFIDNAGKIFCDLPMNRVDAFSKMFSLKDRNGNVVVATEDEEEIWQYFESLVRISIKYIHEKRHPTLLREKHQEIRKYGKTFFPEVDINYHAKVWDITFDFPEEG